MRGTATQYSEAILLRLHKFAIGNWLGIRDACYLLEAVRDEKTVIYQIDFSDLHPYIFPGRTQQDVERGGLSYHGVALKYLWDSVFTFGEPGWEEKFSRFPFRLAMSPATRLEALEALWHAKLRMYRQFRKYASAIVPYVKFKRDSIEVPNREKLYKILVQSDYKTFLIELHKAVSDQALAKDLTGPVGSLTFLLDMKAIQNLEESLPNSVLDDLVEKGYPRDIDCYTQKLYQHKPRMRGSKAWSHQHDKFHDQVDEANIALAYSISRSDEAKEYYAPLLSHTGRLIGLATELMDYSKCLLVNHTLAPLFIVRGSEQHSMEDLPSFLNFGKALIARIARELRQMPEVDALLEMDPTDLKEKLKEGRPVDLPGSLMDKLRLFSAEYYDLIEGAALKSVEKSQGPTVMPRPITVEDIIDLFRRSVEFAEKVREGVATVKERFHQQNCVLAEMFGALGDHVRQIDDWLTAQEPVDLERELDLGTS